MKNFYVENDEQTKAVLGIRYCDNYEESRSIYCGNSGFCAVSDKRVYFKGNSYYSDGGHYRFGMVDRMMDIMNIRGSGYVRSRKMSTLVLITMIVVSILLVVVGIYMYDSAQYYVQTYLGKWKLKTDYEKERIAYALFVVAAIIFIVFLCGLRTIRLFEIAFNGGKIGYDIRFYDEKEIFEFQNNLTQFLSAKQNMAGNQSYIQGQIMNHTCINTNELSQSYNDGNVGSSLSGVNNTSGTLVDEIIKCKSLLDAGAITQDEYEVMKKNILRGE